MLNVQRETTLGWVNEVGENMFADNEREIKFYKWENYLGKCEKFFVENGHKFPLKELVNKVIFNTMLFRFDKICK